MKSHILLFFLCCGFGKVYAENLRVVSCIDELGIERFVAYDIWKQSAMFPESNYDVGGENWEEKVKYVIKKVSTFEPLFAKGLEKNFKELLAELDESFVDRIISRGASEREVYDFGGETCEIKDISMSFEEPFYKQKNLYISRKIWEKLDHPDKASLILNELFRRSILDFDNASIEEYVSYVTFFLLSDLSENIESSEYFKFRFSRQYRTFSKVRSQLEKIKQITALELLKHDNVNILKFISKRSLRYALYIFTVAPTKFNLDLFMMDDGLSEKDFVKYLLDESIKTKGVNGILYIHPIPQLVKTVYGFSETKQFLEDSSLKNLNIFYQKLDEFLDDNWGRLINRKR